jgi:hemolysin III
MSDDPINASWFELKRPPRGELANSLTHGLALAASLPAAAALVAFAWLRGTGFAFAGCVVFGSTLILLYAASTAYHMAHCPRTKRVLHQLDHCAIYLLIAGSYTPFTLTLFREHWGWPLFALVWAIAVLGITARLIAGNRVPALSVASYLAMGWLIVLVIHPILQVLPTGGFLWLLAGGLTYTAGILFFIWDNLPHNHAIWHLFVIGGSSCHYLAVLFYVVPAKV